jgi:hypothetical protein
MPNAGACWASSAWRPTSPSAIRTSCRAARRAGWAWRARWRWTPSSSWPTSRPPASTSRCRARSSTSSPACRTTLGLSILMVTHNLNIVRHVTDRVAIMYLGRFVETGPTDDIFRSPTHPYTAALLAANPAPDPDKRPERIELSGDVPSLLRRPSRVRVPHPLLPHARPVPRAGPGGEPGEGEQLHLPLSAGGGHGVATALSSSGEPKARPGDPVITHGACEYWVARSSRAMTAGGRLNNPSGRTRRPSTCRRCRRSRAASRSG